MDLQRLIRIKTSVQAIKLHLESLILLSPSWGTGIHPITKHRTLNQIYSHGNYQQLNRADNNGRDLQMRDWKPQHNIIQKRTKHTTSSRKFIDEIAFGNHSLQGFKSFTNNYCLTSNDLVPATLDRRQFLAIHKSILLVRHYSRLVPKVERWRAKDKKDRRQLAKLVDCVPGKSNDYCEGGFFKNIFGRLFGWKGSADLKCKPCRKQRGSSKLTESKQKKKVEETEDDCDVDINGKKANKTEKKMSKTKDDCDVIISSGKLENNVRKNVSKTKDDCDVKSDEPSRAASKTQENCASNTFSERANNSCAKTSKQLNRTDSSASICQQSSNRMKPSNSCNTVSSSDRLKQLDTLEKCIGTLQQLIKNLKLEEEMKRAAKQEASKPIICPEPKKTVCPEPKKPACPEPEKPICPVPIMPVCPEPFKKPAFSQPKKPVCPEPKKPVCPEPKKPACPEPKKPACPEPKKPVYPEPKKPVCPETEKPICSEAENTNNQDGGEEPYKCGIIEDITPPKRRHGKQNLGEKNDKYSVCVNRSRGKENSKHRDEQFSQKVKNCADEDDSKNNC